MLGMYFNQSIEQASRELQRRQSSQSDQPKTQTTLDHHDFINDLIRTQKLRMFPQTHDYVTQSGAVIKKELFGKSIDLVDHLIAKKHEKMQAMHDSVNLSTPESHGAAHSGQQQSCTVPTQAPWDMCVQHCNASSSRFLQHEV